MPGVIPRTWALLDASEVATAGTRVDVTLGSPSRSVGTICCNVCNAVTFTFELLSLSLGVR